MRCVRSCAEARVGVQSPHELSLDVGMVLMCVPAPSRATLRLWACFVVLSSLVCGWRARVCVVCVCVCFFCLYVSVLRSWSRVLWMG